METKVLIDKLQQVEYDDFSMRNYSIYSIIEKIEAVANPVLIEDWVEYEQYGRKRLAKLVFNSQPKPLTLIIEQTGSNGVYATYFEYKY